MWGSPRRGCGSQEANGTAETPHRGTTWPVLMCADPLVFARGENSNVSRRSRSNVESLYVFGIWVCVRCASAPVFKPFGSATAALALLCIEYFFRTLRGSQNSEGSVNYPVPSSPENQVRTTFIFRAVKREDDADDGLWTAAVSLAGQGKKDLVKWTSSDSLRLSGGVRAGRNPSVLPRTGSAYSVHNKTDPLTSLTHRLSHRYVVCWCMKAKGRDY